MEEQIVQQIIANYTLKEERNIQNALKQVFEPIFKAVLKGELQNYCNYEKNEHAQASTNVHNGYFQKNIENPIR